MKKLVALIIVLSILVVSIHTTVFAAGGGPEVQYEKGMDYFEKNDFDSAFSYFQISGEVRGYAPAQNMLGVCYRDGLGTEKDLAEAEKYFTLAADQGDPDAKENLSAMSVDQEEVYQNAMNLFFEGNYEEAKSLFESLDSYKRSKDFLAKCEEVLVAANKTPPVITSVTLDDRNHPVITWEPVQNAVTYKVYYSIDNSLFHALKDCSVTSITSDKYYVHGVTYYFKVTAVFKDGTESDYSKTLSIDIPALATPTPEAIKSSPKPEAAKIPEYTITGTVLTVSGADVVDPGKNIKDWETKREEITEVIIKGNPKRIRSFGICSNLKKINIPDSVTEIDGYTFLGCRKLESINIPNGIKTIGDSTFNDCQSLESINIPESVTTIGEWAFWNCDKIKSITLPKNVKKIGYCAFSSCDALKSINIPDSLEYLGDGVFSCCPKLDNINISTGNQCVEIVEGALFSKKDDRLIFLDNSITGLYTVPKRTKIIGTYLISQNNITEVTIPEEVEEIRENAFSLTWYTKLITVPPTVKKIGENAFNRTQIINVEKGSYAEEYCQKNNLKYTNNKIYKIGDSSPASGSSGKTVNSYYIVGGSKETFDDLYKKMCVNLDLKQHPVTINSSSNTSNKNGAGDQEIYEVINENNESYEYIGYVCKNGQLSDKKYIVRSWTGYHEHGERIQMKVYYSTDGKYIGNIRKDLTNNKSNSSSNSPYFIPGEGTHNLK